MPTGTGVRRRPAGSRQARRPAGVIAAISRYAERQRPEPALLGGTPREEALTLMWAQIVGNDGGPSRSSTVSSSDR